MKPIKLDDLTPIEKAGDFLFKRDDLFAPFSVPLNGGKVRQALYLIQTNYKRIKQSGGIVSTVSSVHSPQGYLITRCADHCGFKTMVGIGTPKPKEVPDRYPPFRGAVDMGAKLVQLAKIGYNTVLESRMRKKAKSKGWFHIGFGIASDLSINSHQVGNLPKVDNLVIPAGSGISASAILTGIGRMPLKARPKNIYVIQIAGIDRRKTIRSMIPYNFVADKTYPYHERVDLDYHGVPMDNIYEAKAFNWLLRSKLKGVTLFWIIGNFNIIRGKHE